MNGIGVGTLREGDGVQRIVSFGLWLLALVWVVGWMVWAAYREELPGDLLWVLFALIAWWLVGGASKEGRRRR